MSGSESAETAAARIAGRMLAQRRWGRLQREEIRQGIDQLALTIWPAEGEGQADEDDLGMPPHDHLM